MAWIVPIRITTTAMSSLHSATAAAILLMLSSMLPRMYYKPKCYRIEMLRDRSSPVSFASLRIRSNAGDRRFVGF